MLALLFSTLALALSVSAAPMKRATPLAQVITHCTVPVALSRCGPSAPPRKLIIPILC
ncbi:hypothetical protein H0H93_012668 [Arthromyces matolae]|nr:hypothetical protein H0H93_012668 [Arthromyces matolae]